MKKVFFLTVLFLFPFNLLATDKTPQKLQDINLLEEKLDNCMVQQKNSRETIDDITNTSFSATQQQKLNYDLIDCYKKIAYEIFDLFYTEKKDTMKKSFENYIQHNYELNNNIYDYNNTCYISCGEDCHENCGLITNVLGTQATVNATYDALLRMLTYTKNRLKD